MNENEKSKKGDREVYDKIRVGYSHKPLSLKLFVGTSSDRKTPLVFLICSINNHYYGELFYFYLACFEKFSKKLKNLQKNFKIH